MTRHRVKNWSKYNRNLVQRGKLTFWVSTDSLKKWCAPRQKKEGHPFVYSDQAILTALVLKGVYQLPYRALQGLIASLFSLARIDLPIPCYTQICRRARSLKKGVRLSQKRPTDLVFDASGLKVYGEGEWKVRQHGADRRRKWIKIHLAVCPDSHEIILAEATDATVDDGQMMQHMLQQAPRSVETVFGDGAYDTRSCHKAIYDYGAKPIIPPRKGSAYELEPADYWKARNDSVAIICGFGNDSVARGLWKKFTGYHTRSLAETAFSRFKRILGPRLYSRRKDAQRVELMSKCLILNAMNASKPIAFKP